MDFRERLSLGFKICLPVLLVGLLNLSPVPEAVTNAWNDLYTARYVGGHELAAHGLRTILTYQPWREELWEPLGHEELAAGRTGEATVAFLEGQRAGVLSAEAQLLIGELYQTQGEDAAAEAYWLALLDNEDLIGEASLSTVYENLARLQRKRGDLKAAVATLQAWTMVDPQNPLAAYWLGMHLAALNPEQALQPLLLSSRLDSQYTPMVQTLRSALNLAESGDNPAYGRLMVGRALGHLEQWDLAAESFRQAIAIFPEYGDAWAFLGEAHHHLGKGGKTELDRAYQFSSDSALVRALMSLYWRRHGEPEKALLHLQAIARKEPDEPVWQVELGNTWVEKGDLPSAQECFEKAVRMAPRDTIYWQYLARFSVSNGVDVQGLGLPAARQAVVLAPNDPSALDILGWALLNVGDMATAERILQQAYESDPLHGPTLLHLGQLYLEWHQPDDARRYLEQAVETAGSNSVGLMAQRLLDQNFGATR